MAGKIYSLEVQPHIPERLQRLQELANNLIYSWDRRVRGLFFRIDPALWESCNHNPKVFLRRVAQDRLEALTAERSFMQEYQDVLAMVDSYHQPVDGTLVNLLEGLDPEHDLIAYFCAEFGLHESLQLYSGGLGILAGDYCKAASDIGLPLVAVGLMYRQGYFTQQIDAEGHQQALFQPASLDDLPITPACDAEGKEIRVQVQFPGRMVTVMVWQAICGRVTLYLLDTELPENSRADRAITYQLYGGDRETRIAQEIILGIGGAKALRALGLDPTVWHINEGHPAFLIAERCREAVAGGLEFDAALEQVAAETVFTTHTPVPAGHDVFSRDLILFHLKQLIAELGIKPERFLDLGSSPQNPDEFNMTAFALRGSRSHNGVSRIHGEVASKMESYVWPEIDPSENPIQYVSNGVHVPTFLAREWANLFDARYPAWRFRMTERAFWNECIDGIADHRFWSLRQSLKSEMLADVALLLERQYRRNNVGKGQIEHMLKALSPSNTHMLIIGFARRFATYKRALLIFRDPQRLLRLLSNPERPVIMLFAGKAHPQDRPGQDLILAINRFARQPEFVEKIFFVEDYDIALARKLVTGTDVWINTPEYPQEASGTSGQKAAINGVVNVSILDGWWADGFDGENGWGIIPHNHDISADMRDRVEAEELLDILEHEVIPMFFERTQGGYSKPWVTRSKASMKSIMPRFNAQRMVRDYVRQHYLPSKAHGAALHAENDARARTLAAWKRKIESSWQDVRMRWDSVPPARIYSDEPLSLRVAAALGPLQPADIRIECRLCIDDPKGGPQCFQSHALQPAHAEQEGETLFSADVDVAVDGLTHYEVRAFPTHPSLAHPLEMGKMIWL